MRDFFEPQNVILMVISLGCMLGFRLLLLSVQFVIFLRLKRSNCVPSLFLVNMLGEFRLMVP